MNPLPPKADKKPADDVRCFAVRRRDVAERADVNYASASASFRVRFAHPRFPLVPLGSLSDKIQYGTSTLANYEDGGTRVIRMNNLQDEEWDFSDLKYVTLPENEVEAYRLEGGDILFNRTNSKELVGKCGVFREEGLWVFASYLIRLRLDRAKADPDFVSAFLNTAAGRSQIDRVSRQIIGMTNINTDEIRGLLIPLPASVEVQRDMVMRLHAKRDSRRRRLAEANALLASLDDYVIGLLKIRPPEPDSRTEFGLTLGAVRGRRLDPHFYLPYFTRLLRTVAAKPHALLGDIATLSGEYWDPRTETAETFKYVEISGINTATGEVVAEDVPTAEAPSRARMRLKAGDVVVSLTRPNRGAIAIIPPDLDGAIGSNGLAVIRDVKVSGVRKDYLWAALRSRICLDQMLQRSSGGNYPAITEDELLAVAIPTPAASVQDEIVGETLRRRGKMAELRSQASHEWSDAKAEFERALLG